MARHCIRFKQTPAGRRCAKYSRGYRRAPWLGEFGELGAYSDVGELDELGEFGAFGAARRPKCNPVIGVDVRTHSRSCPRGPLPTRPKHKGYKTSRAKVIPGPMPEGKMALRVRRAKRAKRSKA
jgi:hypothetical protein